MLRARVELLRGCARSCGVVSGANRVRTGQNGTETLRKADAKRARAVANKNGADIKTSEAVSVMSRVRNGQNGTEKGGGTTRKEKDNFGGS